MIRALGFTPLNSDQCVYRKGKLWILLYVDDVIIIGDKLDSIIGLKSQLSSKLEMKDMGELSNFLGISFRREREGAWLSQTHYVTEILKRFRIETCNPVSTPASLNDLHPNGDAISANQTLYQEMVGALFFSLRERDRKFLQRSFCFRDTALHQRISI